MRFPIGRERVTWGGSKLTNSPGKQQLELSTRIRTWSDCATWNRGRFVSQPAPSQRQANDSSHIFYFWVGPWAMGGITKHFMTGPAWNSDFRFPKTSMSRVWEKQNSLFPLGPVSTSLNYVLIIQRLHCLWCSPNAHKCIIQSGK